MKRALFIVILLFSCILAVMLALKPAVNFLLTKELKLMFPGSKISLRGCIFRPFSNLNFSEIKIQKEKDYELKIKDFGFNYSLGTFVKRDGLNITIGKLDYSFVMAGFQANDISLKLEKDFAHLELFVRQLKYNKVDLNDLKGMLRIDNNTLSSEYLSARIWDGQIKAGLNAKLDNLREYVVDLKLSGLNVERLINDFDLAERFQMSGTINGPINLKGSGNSVSILEGNLSAGSEGGKLIIKDNNFMQGMAQKTGQSLDLIVESFKDYHYNTGIIKLSLEQGNIILNVDLDGETGKRNLEIRLHNVIPIKEGLK